MYAFDRDGVLVGILGDFAAGHPKNYNGAEMPIIKEVLAKVPPNSIIISNQAGIDRGYTTLKVVQSQFNWLMARQPNFIGAFFCPDEGENCWFVTRWTSGWIQASEWSRKAEWCMLSPDFRKPNTGMGIFAEKMFSGAKITHYIGDLSGNPHYADGRDSDRQFAQNLGCEYLDVNDFLG